MTVKVKTATTFKIWRQTWTKIIWKRMHSHFLDIIIIIITIKNY